MCGIAGGIGEVGDLEIDLALLAHRGPDGQAVADLSNGYFGHTRLAIIDVEQGDQPISNPSRTCWLVCNGEIYNHLQLRSGLTNYDFQTDSDSEVILALYEQYGDQFVEHLDGMYAFALVDEARGRFYLVRDPIGIKPLYYGWKDGVLYFASEMKAIQNLVDQFHEFPAGYCYSNQTGFAQYYDLHEARAQALERAATNPISLDDIRDALRQAVRKRLMSDVPLGVYLSGGLDSTIIAALVTEELPGVHSFAVGVEDSEDLANARYAAQILRTTHHEVIYTLEEMLAALPEVIYHLESFDPGLVRSAIPNYFLAKLTREYVTVVLTGEGADELYAGYHYLKRYNDDSSLHDELTALLGSLHNCNLQRCDRMTMAHSIEGRVPFLDTEFIEISLAVPAEMKIHPTERIEKWALRRAFEDILPEEIVWRVKQQFSKGAGSGEMMADVARRFIDDAAFEQERRRALSETGVSIDGKEMLLYYREFMRHFTPEAASLVEVWRGNGS